MDEKDIKLRDQNDPPMVKPRATDRKREALRIEFKKYFGYKPVFMTTKEIEKHVGQKAPSPTKVG